MKRPYPRPVIAFSLVEVVLALGLISFALISMIGLFGVGLKTGKESVEYTQAGNLASALLLSCRAATNTANGTTFPIPFTNVATAQTDTKVVGIQGTTLTNGLPPYDIYNLKYTVSPGPAPHLINIYILLWWPPQAAKPLPGNYYETTTQIVTP